MKLMTIRKSVNNLHEEFAVTIEPLVQSDSYSHMFYMSIKRFLDILLALMGFLITVPILLLICLAIKVETAGPAIYVQERVGQNGKYFNLLKLRSMRIDAEVKGAQWAERNDPRITKIGSFIRKTRIDELPQLLNVIKGDMSLIGPRPERPMFTAQFNEEIHGFVKRLALKPGLTGWAQVNGGYEITPKEKLELDEYYIENCSILLDCKIIYKTFFIVFTGDGAR